MNRFINGFIVAALILGGIWYWVEKKEDKDQIREESSLIQEQIVQVGKLIVTEGYFSQVFTFKNSQSMFLDMIKLDKKALVVANAKATVEYDLRKLETEVDLESKTVRITKIPDPVINIYPEIEYYDVTQDYFNQFGANDYNKIKSTVSDRLRQKIEKSDLKKDARDRLMSELVSIYQLTNTMGWTLMYQEMVIGGEEQLKGIEKN
ncbi:DUF4230 domain-containing protein [Algoriphagus zhangzhouensis]|uniref:DUF4230 domain-containing protein n=1 Tax=Algoriphagus zhangzhouensis TaxID=1073327 RepID=A0A1M7ZCN0_9BACT|nr:DUF4230 domain-containing protein [Algoriphagus zhangzhouensis]TDY45601.1 uncharacterized protein DUF4230 [Algoriphagus zhangzhouensis]SHO62620.1 Protein of unknown function [Algoriphagus zhangzhouensis]